MVKPKEAQVHIELYTVQNAVNTWIKTSHIHAKLQSALRDQINMSTSSVHKEITTSAKKMHIQHVEQLKQKLRGYSLDPFSQGNARHMTTGKELDPKMIDVLLNAPKLGNEKYKEFVQARLVEGKVNFYQPIKRLMLPTGLKKTKKQPKAVSILKQDRQAFGTLLTKSINLETAFQHPLTEVPLSIATPGGEIRQAPKHLLRNHIIEEANAITNVYPENARWLIDGIAAMRCVKARDTYKEWLLALLKFSTPPFQSHPLSVEIINDTYRKESVKSGTRLRRGEESSRIHIQGYDQKMLQGNAWNSVFNNIENKTELVELAANFFQTEEGRKSLSVPLIFTCGENTLELTKTTSNEIFKCNHEEADTRLILHASLQDTDVVVVAKDTDVFVLMVYAYNKLQPCSKWYMKIDHEKYVDISKVSNHLGTEISSYLPQLHSLTGCDTTSFFYGVGKIKVLNKVKKNKESLNLLQHVGQNEKLSQRGFEDSMKFVQTVMYSGKETESLVETRIRLYKSLKTKASLAIPPDPDSLRQAMLRVHFQAYYWLQCDSNRVTDIKAEDNGWKKDLENDILVPIWFTGKYCFIS